jgi:hypothetical protein
LFRDKKVVGVFVRFSCAAGQQSLELKAASVPVLHYYSMGKSENIRQIIAKFFF